MFAVDTETILFTLSTEVGQTLVVDVIAKPRVFFLVLVVCDEVHLTASFFSYRCGGCPVLGKDHPTADKERTASVS